MTTGKRTALLLCLLALLGCSRELEPAASSIPPQGPVSVQSPAPAPDVPTFEECDISPMTDFERYRYWGDGKVYTHEQVPFEGKQDLLSAVNLAASALPYVTGPLPVLGITREKAFVTVDFSGEFTSTYSKGEIYELLNTVSMTLMQNSIADSLRFTVAGETGVFGELWETEPFAVAEGDPAQFAAIRAEIAYPGLSELYFPTADEIKARFGVSMDETAMEIARLLARVGKMEHDAASPQELDMPRFYYHCIQATPWFSPQEGDEGYHPKLLPIADSASAKLGMMETMFWIGEHVEETARVLCGDDFILDLSSEMLIPYVYLPVEGVITPPHMGGGYSTLPLVLSYEENADGYRAEVVYLFESMGGIGPWGSERNYSDRELPGYVANEAERAEVTVRREDGRLCFESYRVQ